MPSWNKGKTGLEAGWTPERRKRASEKQKQWIRDNPDKSHFWLFKKGVWKTGPDPEVHRHYYRYMRMKCQARYWCQDWTIKWEDYLDLLKSSSGRWGRTKDSINLVRIDKSQGWHLDNVELMNRTKAMKRPRLTDDTGKMIRRKKRNG